jgi:hypothetical protein
VGSISSLTFSGGLTTFEIYGRKHTSLGSQLSCQLSCQISLTGHNLLSGKND